MTALSTSATRAPAPPDGLFNVSEVPPLREYLRQVWARRDYLKVVPLSELRAQHYDTVLGNFWHVLSPTMLMGVYFLVFGVGLRSARNVDNFITFLAVGVFVFHYTQRSIMQGSKAIISNDGLIRSIRFPRMILPIAAVIEEFLAFLPALAVMLTIAVSTGETPGVSWLILPVALTIQTVFNFGTASIGARITDVVRDFHNVLPFVLRIVFYASGILYSVEQRVDSGAFKALFYANPIYAIIGITRGGVMDDPIPGWLWLSALGWTVAFAVAGFAFFKSGEQTYGRG